MNFRMIKTIIYSFLLIQSILFAQTDSIQSLNHYSLADTVKANEYFNIGKSYQDKSKYDSSIIAYSEVEKIYAELLKNYDDKRLWLKLIQTKNYLGYNLCYLGLYDKSILYLDEAETLCKEKLGLDNKTAAQIYQAKGIYYDYTDDLNKSIEMFYKALEIRIRIFGEEHSDVADTYNSIGIIYSKKSNRDKALEYFTRSLNIKKKVLGDEHSHTAAAYNNIGINYYERGDYGKALEYYHQALSIRLKTIGEMHHLTASSYNNIGNCLNEIGEFDKAEENHLKALEIRKKVLGKDHDLVATSLTNLGLTSWRKGEYDKALEYLYLSLNIRLKKQKANHSDIAMNYMNIGVMHKAKNELDSAISYCNKAIEIFKNIGDLKSVNVSKVYQNIAETYFAKEKHDLSLSAIQKSMQSIVFDFNDDNIESNPKFDLILSEVQLLSALKIKSKNYTALSLSNSLSEADKIKYLTKSLFLTELADSLIDKMLAGFKNENSKLFLGEKTKSIFEQGIEASYLLYKLTGNTQYQEKILYFIEKSKAAVLRQGIIDSKAKVYSNISPDIFEKEKILKEDLLFYEAKLKADLVNYDKKDSLKISETQSIINKLKIDYENLISKIEKEFPAYYKLKYKTKISTLDQTQKVLPANTVLINYFVGDKSIYIATISSNNFYITMVSKPDDYNQSINDFYSSIKKAETNNFISSCNKISDILYSPISQFISKLENLEIIPDDLLYKIPFEVLFTESQSSETKNFSNLNYLINKFNIKYHYSANLLLSSQIDKSMTESNGHSNNFIGFAPIFPKDNSFGYTITNNNSANLLASNDEVLRSVSVDGKNYDELKYSEWEVNSIIDLFNKNNSSSINTAYFYSDAKEDSFKTNVKDYKIIHIASHSFMNADQPNLSGVIFAQPQDSVFNNDGILYSGETYNLDLNADLVVLSSCESGLGKLFKGEGMIGLTRGFLYSGANNIMFSLWKISDKHTSELMIEFYRQMMNGKKYSDALRLAKLKLISSEITARPRSWAGFLLIGTD